MIQDMSVPVEAVSAAPPPTRLNRFSVLGMTQTFRRRPVEAFGGTVYVREMSAGERCQFEEQVTKKSWSSARSWLVCKTCESEPGVPLFEEDDVERIDAMPYGAVVDLFEAASELSLLTKKDRKELGEPEKN